jgi:hypothetical protein
MILGIAGCMEAGKSSLARHLHTKIDSVAIAPMASTLRFEVAIALKDLNKPDSIPTDVGEAFDHLASMGTLSRNAAFKDKPTPPAARLLLQWWGTDYRRKMNTDYWLEQHQANYSALFEESSTLIICDDIRFPNEVDYVHEHEGKVMWLSRSTSNDKSHKSEHAIASKHCDWSIDSNVPLTQMLDTATMCVKGWLHGKEGLADDS